LTKRNFRFAVVNVFAETHFGGNPLAVFPDARGLSDKTMQLIARQFNLAETTFVFPPVDVDNAASIRIFTPLAELPFAGHPTIGTASVLARLDRGAGTLVLEERIGSIPVDVHFDGENTFAELSLSRRIQRADISPNPDALTRVLSIDRHDVIECWFASAGVRFCFVQLASQVAVDRAILDRAAWASHLRDAWSPNLFIFAGNPRVERIYARMFAPALGVDEDPASGAAVIALVGALAEQWFDQNGSISVDIDQGVSMGRPSVLRATAEVTGGRATTVTLRGQTIFLANGEMLAPVGE
jgi:trans-2,3-dihydro-3-hydroxyanthranilate isomerase